MFCRHGAGFGGSRRDLRWVLGRVRVGSGDRIWPIADEDMDRSKEDKTAAVHFMRYEVPEADRQAAKAGEPIVFGVEHVAYPCEPEPVSDVVRTALTADFTH